MLPASETKHVQLLSYEFGGKTFQLQQRDEHGLTNGTTLWLGGQVLSYYLASILIRGDAKDSTSLEGLGRRKRVIELGSGIGMTALALHSLGWDVCATDVEPVLSSVLRPNVEANTPGSVNGTAPEDANNGKVECKELDWTIHPDRWRWSDALSIAGDSEVDEPLDEQERANDVRRGEDNNLLPPFDLIVTADTLYISELVTPLLRTLHNLARLSAPTRSSRGSSTTKLHSCPIYVCVERRDPDLMDRAFEECKSHWGFTIERVRSIKIRKALERAKMSWIAEKNTWEGIEIWKMRLPVQEEGLNIVGSS